ncbi:Iduronate 2-sulfatase (Alpha-L-iduronate sulfate sulfatase) (Idursulfase) [Cleaved into: Iduronate 2-sulfatase 42 kDa chain [Durusdinium trenchii]|uniref:Iduronate 2-sulfatase (Alpha-L-iduronate sulfate sulfatase) (Idursulfase) [Cleaved into: Iduronate 2-sulfatase 42 kDa chain n=1 Tax=Durusdinium trenchii TaxID=1381693 RepID=A0ABP0HCB8_9DINO
MRRPAALAAVAVAAAVLLLLAVREQRWLVVLSPIGSSSSVSNAVPEDSDDDHDGEVKNVVVVLADDWRGQRHGLVVDAAGKVFHGQTDERAFDKVVAPSTEFPFRDSACSKPMVRAGKSRPLRTKDGSVLSDVMCRVAKDRDVIDLRTVELVGQRIHWLARNAPKGFALFVGLVSTHLPFQSAERFWEQHDFARAMTDAALDVPSDERGPPDDPRAFEPSMVRGKRFTGATVSRSQRRAFRLGYRVAMSQLDAAFGKIVDALTDADLLGSTAVVFTADHGFSLGEHGHFGKRSLEDPSIRVPFYVRCPWCKKSPSAIARASPVQSLDLYRTVAGLLGLGTAVPANVEGRDLMAPEAVDDKLGPVAFSQVLRCHDEVCPIDISPLAANVKAMGLVAVSRHWKLVLWLRASAEATSVSLDWSGEPLDRRLYTRTATCAWQLVSSASTHQASIRARPPQGEGTDICEAAAPEWLDFEALPRAGHSRPGARQRLAAVPFEWNTARTEEARA